MASVSRTKGLIHLGLDVHKDSISVAILHQEKEAPEVERIFHDEVSVRASVGAAILNRENQVLVLEREDHPGSWQLPQGGIEPGETPRDAVFRELREEAGLDESSVDLLDEIPGWLAYELPLDSQSAKTGRGQTQRWFLFRLRDPLAKIETQSTSAPVEFTSSKWVSPNELAAAAVEFRQPTYREIVKAIEELDT